MTQIFCRGLKGIVGTACTLPFPPNVRSTTCLSSHLTMSSSSSSGKEPADVQETSPNWGGPQKKQRTYKKQVPTGASIVLTQGATQPGNCADVVVACETACGVLGKSSWTKKNSTRGDGTRWLHVRCSSEIPPGKGTKSPGVCSFQCNAVEGDKNTPTGQVRITVYDSNHLCSQGNGRKRAVSVAVRMGQSATLGNFVPVVGRRNGNMAQLQESVLRQDGYRMKKGQVYNVLSAKAGSIATHLASYRMIEGWIAFMRKKDPKGTYELRTCLLKDGDGVNHRHFRYLFVAPSATKEVPHVTLVCLSRNHVGTSPSSYVFHFYILPRRRIIVSPFFVDVSDGTAHCVHSPPEVYITFDIIFPFLCTPSIVYVIASRSTSTLKKSAPSTVPT